MIGCRAVQQSGSLGLVVISESDSRTLLLHRICREDIYQRQGGARLKLTLSSLALDTNGVKAL